MEDTAPRNEGADGGGGGNPPNEDDSGEASKQLGTFVESVTNSTEGMHPHGAPNPMADALNPQQQHQQQYQQQYQQQFNMFSPQAVAGLFPPQVASINQQAVLNQQALAQNALNVPGGLNPLSTQAALHAQALNVQALNAQAALNAQVMFGNPQMGGIVNPSNVVQNPVDDGSGTGSVSGTGNVDANGTENAPTNDPNDAGVLGDQNPQQQQPQPQQQQQQQSQQQPQQQTQDQPGGGEQQPNDNMLARRLLLEEERQRFMFLGQNPRNMLMQGQFMNRIVQPQQLLFPQGNRFMMPNAAMMGGPQMQQLMAAQQNAMMQGAPAGLLQPTPLGPGFMPQTANMFGMNPPMDSGGNGLFLRTENNVTASNIPGTRMNAEETNDFKEEDEKRSPSPEMPVRPLSAYNFFFSDERERILKQGEKEDSEGEVKPEDEPEEDPEEKKKRLLDQHLNKDRTKRRPHRKTHGKIGFTNLSKLIGKRWRELPEDKKQYYREIAAMDMDRYQRSVAQYNNERLSKRAKR